LFLKFIIEAKKNIKRRIRDKMLPLCATSALLPVYIYHNFWKQNLQKTHTIKQDMKRKFQVRGKQCKT
jgi:hypothetical protein